MSIHPFPMRILSLVSGAVLMTGLTGAAALAQLPPGPAQQPQTQTMPGVPLPGTPGAQLAEGSAPDTDAQVLEDREFVRMALEGDMAEAQLGQLAATKASSEDVKSFGQKMVDDHTRLGNGLSQVAQGAGVTPPAGLSKKDKRMLAKLRGLSGSQFDDAYISAMVKDHKKDDDTFKLEAERAQLPAVKQAAAEGERVIAGHLQLIEQIAQTHDIEGGITKNHAAPSPSS